MKHMKQIVMGLMLIALAVAGYKAYQYYYGPQQENVKIQYAKAKSDGNSCFGVGNQC